MLQLCQGHSLRPDDAYGCTVREDCVLPVQEQTQRSDCTHADGKLRGSDPKTSRPAVSSIKSRRCLHCSLRPDPDRHRCRVLCGGHPSLSCVHALAPTSSSNLHASSPADLVLQICLCQMSASGFFYGGSGYDKGSDGSGKMPGNNVTM